MCLQGDQQDGLRKATPGSPAVEKKSLLEERLHPAVSLEGGFANRDEGSFLGQCY